MLILVVCVWNMFIEENLRFSCSSQKYNEIFFFLSFFISNRQPKFYDENIYLF